VDDEFPRFFGRYVLEKRLSRGGMGDVFLALGEAVRRRCVIKTIRDDLEGDTQMIRRFSDEAVTMVEISHPNVVRCFDAGRVDGAYYIAMEYVHGATLADLLDQGYRKRERMPLGVAAYITEHLLQALAYIHALKGPDGRSMNLVHRDIAPENILIGFDGLVKLSDFGLAKNQLLPARTRGDFALGRLGYMPPEQALHEEIDGRADLYALGATMFEVFSGERLVNDTDPDQQALWKRVVKPKHRSLKSVRPELPGSVDELVMTAVQGKKADRWEDASAMLAHLHTMPVRSSTSAGFIEHLKRLFPAEAFEPLPIPDIQNLPRPRGSTKIFATSIQGACTAFGLKALPDAWNSFEGPTAKTTEFEPPDELPTKIAARITSSLAADDDDTIGMSRPSLEAIDVDSDATIALQPRVVEIPAAKTELAEAPPLIAPTSPTDPIAQTINKLPPPPVQPLRPAEPATPRRWAKRDLLLLVLVLSVFTIVNVLIVLFVGGP